MTVSRFGGTKKKKNGSQQSSVSCFKNSTFGFNRKKKVVNRGLEITNMMYDGMCIDVKQRVLKNQEDENR